MNKQFGALFLTYLVLILCNQLDAAEKPEPTPYPEYETLSGVGGAGSAFVMKYRDRLVAGMSRHQFRSKGPQSMILTPSGAKIALNSNRVFNQTDVQIIPLAGDDKKVPFLDFYTDFHLKQGERLWINRGGKGGIFGRFVGPEKKGHEYKSSEGSKRLLLKLNGKANVIAASGSPVIQVSTGMPVGVLLEADSGTGASIIVFEPICLPSDGKGAAPRSSTKPPASANGGVYAKHHVTGNGIGITKSSSSRGGSAYEMHNFKLNVEASPGEEKFLFAPDPKHDVQPYFDRARLILGQQGINIPNGHTLEFTTPDGLYLEENGDVISPVLALFMESAITGRSLRKRTHLIADVDADGNLVELPQSWNYLRELRSSHDQGYGFSPRIILPEGSSSEVVQCLTCGNPAPFLNCEVITVKTFEEVRGLCFDDGKIPARLVGHLLRFQKLSEKFSKEMKAADFLKIPKAQEEIRAMAAVAPNLISAQVLLAYLDGKAPTKLPRSLLKLELHAALNYFCGENLSLEYAYGSLRGCTRVLETALKRLEKLTAPDDMEIYDDLQNLIKQMKQVKSGLEDEQRKIQLNQGLVIQKNAQKLRAELLK